MPLAQGAYREPTKAMREKFGRYHWRLMKTVERFSTEDIWQREPSSDGTHFRDTDIGSRIEFTDGKMVYFIVFEAYRIQDRDQGR